MDTYKNLILQYSTKKDSFFLDDLWGWLSAMGLTNRTTMNCMRSRMVMGIFSVFDFFGHLLTHCCNQTRMYQNTNKLNYLILHVILLYVIL